MKRSISVIAAIDLDGALGFKNNLLYHLPDDMKRFKQLTTGHTIIMGRKTFDSLPNGALPNRRNIVVSHNMNLKIPNVLVCPSLSDALNECSFEDEVFIIGGASIYQSAVTIADRLYITLVNAHAQQADVFFPKIDGRKWHIEFREEHYKDEKHKYDFSFINYKRGRKLK